MNKYKQEEQKVEENASTATAKGFKSLLTGSFLSKEKVVDTLPFIFFLTFLGICYIANGYQTQKLVISISKTSNALKELRSEYITTKSELMVISKQSKVAEATAAIGLKELTSPPKKIVVTAPKKKSLFND
jgi:hypothetical protein